MENRLKEFGIITEEELQSGVPDSMPEESQPVPDAETIAHIVHGGIPSQRDDADRQPVFKIGDKVRVRNINPAGHTRAPRYIRGHVGTINRYYHNHIFPDTYAHDKGENPQPLYNVIFDAGELWGPDVKQDDTVCIDLWEDYLESVEE
jgi:nitrile hydratase